MQEPSNGFVLRRRMSGAVIVGSYQDVLDRCSGSFSEAQTQRITA
jgi:hypothetical protein